MKNKNLIYLNSPFIFLLSTKLLKSDLDNIRGTDDPIKGGWLMKGTSVGNSWVRRYALIRGNFLFYFQSASADKPQGVIPLEVSFIEYCYFLIL